MNHIQSKSDCVEKQKGHRRKWKALLLAAVAFVLQKGSAFPADRNSNEYLFFKKRI